MELEVDFVPVVAFKVDSGEFQKSPGMSLEAHCLQAVACKHTSGEFHESAGELGSSLPVISKTHSR